VAWKIACRSCDSFVLGSKSSDCVCPFVTLQQSISGIYGVPYRSSMLSFPIFLLFMPSREFLTEFSLPGFTCSDTHRYTSYIQTLCTCLWLSNQPGVIVSFSGKSNVLHASYLSQRKCLGPSSCTLPFPMQTALHIRGN
jgi:hypothetical protein